MPGWSGCSEPGDGRTVPADAIRADRPVEVGQYEERCEAGPTPLELKLELPRFDDAGQIEFKDVPDDLIRLVKARFQQTGTCRIERAIAAEAVPELRVARLPPGDTIEPTFGCDVLSGADLQDQRLRFWILRVRPGRLGTVLRQLGERLKEGGGIEHLEPVPNAWPPALDEPFLGTSGRNDKGRARKGCGTQWYHYDTRVTEAWERWPEAWLECQECPVIFLADFGFYLDHHELKGILRHESGRNTCNRSEPLNTGSKVHHGTAVAGLLAARRDRKGILGVVYGSEVRPIRTTCDSPEEGDPWVKAVDWARREKVGSRRKVLLLEVEADSGYSFEAVHRALRFAIAQAVAEGVVVVIAAGNGGVDAAAGFDGPNDEDDSGSIVVGATTYGSRERAHFSNYGNRVVVAAPGDREHDVTLSSRGSGSYREGLGGTSGAAPKVAGVVAMMLANNKDLTPAQVRCMLATSGDEVSSARGKPVGRFLDAVQAIEKARAGTCSPGR